MIKFLKNLFSKKEKIDPEFKELMEIRKLIGRGGYGKNGNGPYRSKKLCEMSNEWIKASIAYVRKDKSQKANLKWYKLELKYREKYNIYIPDEKI